MADAVGSVTDLLSELGYLTSDVAAQFDSAISDIHAALAVLQNRAAAPADYQSALQAIATATDNGLVPALSTLRAGKPQT